MEDKGCTAFIIELYSAFLFVLPASSAARGGNAGGPMRSIMPEAMDIEMSCGVIGGRIVAAQPRTRRN